MKAKRDSILFIFSSYQVVVVVIVFLFFLVNGLFLYRTERASTIADRTYQLKGAAEKVNTRIKALDQDVLETLTTILNDYNGLMSDKAGEKSLDKQKINQVLRNKRMLSEHLEFIYVFREDDFMVFQGREDIGIYEHLDLKDFVEEHVREIVTTTKEDSWKICDVNGKYYVIKCYRHAASNMYVGVAATPEKFFQELTVLAQDVNGFFEVTNESGMSYRYPQEFEEKAVGQIELEGIELEGELHLRASFVIGFIEFFQKSLMANFVIALILCLVFVSFMNILIKRKIIYPVKEMAQAVAEIDDLSEQKKIPDDAEVYEIRGLERSINTLLQEVVYSRMQLYTTEIQKKEQELTLLRSQIRPHFFLNAITTVSMMTYQDRGEDIRNYLMRLSTFMRYVITNSATMVTLEEEIEHINNYAQMQEIRFPGKVLIFTTCAPEVAQIRIPRYLILTVIENSYKYAMGTSDVMQIFVQCTYQEEEGFEGVLITVEDNGTGFEEEQLIHYNQLEVEQEKADTHIGLMNIKQTLALHFGRVDLLRISNAIPTGAHIEIRIPDYVEKDEKDESSDSR